MKKKIVTLSLLALVILLIVTCKKTPEITDNNKIEYPSLLTNEVSNITQVSHFCVNYI